MVLIAIFMVMPLSIVRWEACPLKLIIFRFCMVLSPAVGICACWNLPACARFCPLALGSACCCWVLPAVAVFCLLLPAAACCCLLLPAAACCCWLLGSARLCWVLPACGGSCLLVLGSALCFWVLPCASGLCLLLLGSACLCCVNARCLSVRNILPVGFSFMWSNLPILLSGVCCCQGSDLVCISFWSRFWSRFSRLRFPGPFPFPALLWLLCGIFGWCSCLPLALFFGQVLLVDVCCSWSLSLLGRCFLSLPVQCCWVLLRHIRHIMRDMQVSRRQVGHKWRQVGDKCITLYNQAAQSTQTVVGEHARNASPETEAK